MILLEADVLVEAGHRDAEHHESTAAWLSRLLAGPRAVGLVDLALTGALRVLTHPRVFSDPAPPARAVDFIDAVRGTPAAVAVLPTAATWRLFGELLHADGGLRGNLVPDAWLASLAVSHGAALATRDRGFRRFPGLDLVQPGG